MEKQHYSIYTKKGDNCFTSTLGEQEVFKGDKKIEVIGKFDELMVQVEKVMAVMNSLFSELKDGDTVEELELLEQIHKELSVTSAEMSFNKFGFENKNKITEESTKRLETYIDGCKLELTEFVTFKNIVAIEMNEARVRTRSLERVLVSLSPRIEITSYINRLSDFFFAMAVVTEKVLGDDQ